MFSFFHYYKTVKCPGHRYRLLLQPALMAAPDTYGLNRGRTFGTRSGHDPVPMIAPRHRVVPQTGTKYPRQYRNRVMARPGSNCTSIRTGSIRDPMLIVVRSKGTS